MPSASAVRTALLIVALVTAMGWIAWSQLGADRVRELDDLQVGDCVEIPSGDFTDVVAVPTMRCNRAHNAELYLIGRLDRPREREYPGVEVARREAVELCRGDAFQEYVGQEYVGQEYVGQEYVGQEYVGDEYVAAAAGSSDLEIVTMWPSEIDWRPTRGVVYCFVRLVGDESTTDRLGSPAALR